MLLKILPQLLQGAIITLQLSALGVCIGSLGGVLLGIFSSNQLKIPYIHLLIRGYVAIFRGTPLFIQLLIIYFAIPELVGIDLSPFMAGVLALGFNSIAYVAEIIRGGMNSIPMGQWNASFCLGYSMRQTLQFIILPQTFRNVFPALTNEFIALVKDSSILMLLGVHELTKVSKDIVARELKPFEVYVMTALIYFVITTTISFLSTQIERRKLCH